MFDKFWSRMIKNILDYKALIIFVMFIALGLSILIRLLRKAEFPFQRMVTLKGKVLVFR